jgi:Hemerythrin HHE cation binding domain
MVTQAPAAAGSAEQPLDKFSSCHVGILTQLQTFAGLPALIEPAAQARRIAGQMLAFFPRVIREHHAEEEQELFPAVLGASIKGAERELAQVMIERLTAEHRQLEAMWSRLESPLNAVAKGRDSDLDASAVQRLVATYTDHAQYEEQQFLPFAEALLGRNGNHMAALGLSLHLRHALPEVLSRVGHRI